MKVAVVGSWKAKEASEWGLKSQSSREVICQKSSAFRGKQLQVVIPRGHVSIAPGGPVKTVVSA
jgi:hypothetical protein